MKILVMSDIHANLTALEAVLQSAGEVDATWCLGDLVGYGPDPNECVERVSALPNLTCVKGNHDDAVCGFNEAEGFHEEARRAVLLTRRLMTPANLDFLSTLPEVILKDGFTLAHGSPRNPLWEYILEPYTARCNFALIKTDYAIVGHSHIPLIFTLDVAKEDLHMLTPLEFPLTIQGRAILNPGSVGQPRDNNPRACYAILDPQGMTWEVRRVQYDIQSVQKRILAKGLPERQALRLAEGW